jgi:hypothetical protein
MDWINFVYLLASGNIFYGFYCWQKIIGYELKTLLFVDAPYLGGGGEVLGHMSNGYNSLTFLCFFSYFYGFQHCSKKDG